MTAELPVDPADVMSESTYDPYGPSGNGMTSPLPVTQVTLDAAVEAAMDALCAVQWPALPGDAGPLVPVDHIARAAVTAALPVLAGAIEQQVRAQVAAEAQARAGLGKTESNRRRRDLIRTGKQAPTSHGASGYTDGCRCVVCRDAHTMASRRRRTEIGLGRREPRSHGRTGYDAGCRCQVCSSGKARSR